MRASRPDARPAALTLLGLPLREALLIVAVALVIAGSIGVFAFTTLSGPATPAWQAPMDELDDDDSITDAELMRVPDERQPPLQGEF